MFVMGIKYTKTGIDYRLLRTKFIITIDKILKLYLKVYFH